MGQKKDITNQKFGRLTAIKINTERSKRRLYWECLCDCGNTTIAWGTHLRIGARKSCGCLNMERLRKTKPAKTHGMSQTREWFTWEAMMKRCYKSNHPAYKNYGGRGIKVCERWHTFENFFADMGYKPKKLTIERINNNGNYASSNCKWATSKEQANNRRNNRIRI